MKIRAKYHLFFLLIISTSCFQSFDVERHEAAIVLNEHGFNQDTVFKEGHHSVGASDVVIIYDLRPKQINFAFDVLFEEGSSGNVRFSLLYALNADSIYRFYQNYEVRTIDLIVAGEVRAMIRALMKTIKSGEMTVDQIKEKVNSVMHSDEEIMAGGDELFDGDNEILNYIIVKDISDFEIRLDR